MPSLNGEGRRGAHRCEVRVLCIMARWGFCKLNGILFYRKKSARNEGTGWCGSANCLFPVFY